MRKSSIQGIHIVIKYDLNSTFIFSKFKLYKPISDSINPTAPLDLSKQGAFTHFQKILCQDFRIMNGKKIKTDAIYETTGGPHLVRFLGF